MNIESIYTKSLLSKYGLDLLALSYCEDVNPRELSLCLNEQGFLK